MAEVFAESARQSSNREVTGMFRARVLKSAGKASVDVKTAIALSDSFPAILEALVSGEVNSGHARLMVRVAD